MLRGIPESEKKQYLAAKLYEDKVLEEFKDNRYKSYTEGIGKKIVSGEVSFEELSEYAMSHDQINNESGRQEMLEAIVNQYIYK